MTGSGGFCTEEYWWFDQAGPHRLNFDAVAEALRKAVPENSEVGVHCQAPDLVEQTFRGDVRRRDAECRACGMLGDVTAKFKLQGAVAIPSDVEFTPTNAK